MALFSTSRGGGTGGGGGSSHLAEFRAGKLFMREKLVTADKRKGMVYIHQSDDMLMHFCWKDRTTGNVEDDLIIFPDDVEFVPVKECTTGRVFLLKFKNSTRKLFFWMQEPKAEKDEDYCKKVNELLNNPPAPGSRSGGSGGGGAHESIQGQLAALGFGEGDMNALGGMDQHQMMQFLNLMGGGGGLGGLDSASFPGLGGSATPSTAESSAPSTARTPAPVVAQTPTGPPTSSSVAPNAPSRPSAKPREGVSGSGGESGRPNIQLSDLQSILSGMNVPGGDQTSNEPAIDLEDVLSADNVTPVLTDELNEARLLPHLPDNSPIEQNRQELITTLRSPQFRQAVGSFGMGLQTGQLGPLLSQFGISDTAVAAAGKGDIQSFAEIMQQEEGEGGAGGGSATAEDKKGEKSSEPPNKKGKEDKEKDDEMELD